MSPARSPRQPVHPTADAWFALATGGLSVRARAGLDRHRASCPACDELAERATRLARAIDFSDLEAVPRALRRRAEELFTKRGAPAPSIVARVPRALRLLVPAREFAAAFATGSAVIGVRRGGEVLRRCALEGGPWRVELEWQPTDRAWNLRGRIVGPDDSGAISAALTVEAADQRRRRPAVGPRGFFGPLRLPSPEVRVTLAEGERTFRSPWLPRAPRPRRRK